jgi:hypothetical protein
MQSTPLLSQYKNMVLGRCPFANWDMSKEVAGEDNTESREDGCDEGSAKAAAMRLI